MNRLLAFLSTLGCARALILLAASCGGSDGTDAKMKSIPGDASASVDVDGVAMTSHLVNVNGLTWHFVEGGKGPPVVFVHGAPECWYTWHAQMAALAANYHVIAIDMKGYGKSDKTEGSYNAHDVADETLALIDALGLDRLNLVAHDWGTAIADVIAGEHQKRIVGYVRMEAPITTFDTKLTPWWDILSDPNRAPAFVQTAYNVAESGKFPSMTPLDAEHQARYREECLSRDAFITWSKYFRDTPFGEAMDKKRRLAAAMEFPVLLLQAGNDAGQPRYFFDDVVSLFPNAELQFIDRAGHFLQTEQPAAVTSAIRALLERANKIP